MNTPFRLVSHQLFRDTAHYLALRQHWRTLSNSPRKHNLLAAHHLLYSMLRGRDWRRGFTPIRNQRKLANGGFYAWGLVRAMQMLQSRQCNDVVLTPFDGLVTAEMLETLRTLLPPLKFYRFDPHVIAQHGIPDPAYLPAEEPTHE